MELVNPPLDVGLDSSGRSAKVINNQFGRFGIGLAVRNSELRGAELGGRFDLSPGCWHLKFDVACSMVTSFFASSLADTVVTNKSAGTSIARATVLVIVNLRYGLSQVTFLVMSKREV
jgi:hypothetical protein